MFWYTDWKFLGLVTLFIANILGQIGSIIASNSAKKISTKIMTNDLKHLSGDVKDLKKDIGETNKIVNNIWTAIDDLGKKQSARDAICEERHKNDGRK